MTQCLFYQCNHNSFKIPLCPLSSTGYTSLWSAPQTHIFLSSRFTCATFSSVRARKGEEKEMFLPSFTIILSLWGLPCWSSKFSCLWPHPRWLLAAVCSPRLLWWAFSFHVCSSCRGCCKLHFSHMHPMHSQSKQCLTHNLPTLHKQQDILEVCLTLEIDNSSRISLDPWRTTDSPCHRSPTISFLFQ